MTEATIKPADRVPVGWRVGLGIYGAILILLGLGALLLPLLATFTASITFGGLLFLSGVFGLFTLFVDWRAKGFVWRLLWALVAIVGGLCIYFHPWEGALALTLVLGASLIAQGLVGVGHAISHRHMKGCPWGWMAIGGVITAVLGGLLVWMLPGASLVVPGVFLALSLLSYGLSLIAVSFSGRSAAG